MTLFNLALENVTRKINRENLRNGQVIEYADDTIVMAKNLWKIWEKEK